MHLQPTAYQRAAAVQTWTYERPCHSVHQGPWEIAAVTEKQYMRINQSTIQSILIEPSTIVQADSIQISAYQC